MRSNDVIYSLPFNIAQYAFLNIIFAKLLNLMPGELVYQCSDAHIYSNQFPVAEHIIKNKDTALIQDRPQIHLKKTLNSLKDILNLEFSDFVINYNPLPDFKNKPPMAV